MKIKTFWNTVQEKKLDFLLKIGSPPSTPPSSIPHPPYPPLHYLSPSLQKRSGLQEKRDDSQTGQIKHNKRAKSPHIEARQGNRQEEESLEQARVGDTPEY